MVLKKNQFMSFEGLDGAGKSTLIQLLKLELERNHQKVLVTREPGGTPLGEELRQIIIRRSGDTPTPRAELLLYEAIRAHHVDQLIQPQLESGAWILCDRFTASSIAFQAGGRQINETDVHWLNTFATSGISPSTTILLDLTFEQAKERQKRRHQNQSLSEDRMEAESKEFHERVRASFLTQAEKNKNSWIVLSAMQSPEDLLKELISKLRERGTWVS